MSIRSTLACVALLASVAATLPAVAQDTMQSGSNMKNTASHRNSPSGMAHAEMMKGGAMSGHDGMASGSMAHGDTMAHGSGQMAPSDASPHQ